MRLRQALISALTSLLPAAACSGSTSADPSTSPAATVSPGSTVEVGVDMARFEPSTLTVAAGTTVHFVWATGGHNVVSGENGVADGRFCSPGDAHCDHAPLLPSGTTYSHTFSEPGNYPYFCAEHLQVAMTGTIVVH